MEVNEYIKFANENPIGYLATIEGHNLKLEDSDSGTPTTQVYTTVLPPEKNIYKQLKDNPKVELLFQP